MLFSYDQFLTNSLRKLGWGEKIAKVLAASINAVEPAAAINANVKLDAGRLIVGSQTYNLSQHKRIWVVGAGKAGFPMATAISGILGDKLTKGIMILKDGYPAKRETSLHNRIKFIKAGHPLPDQRSVAGTKKIINLLRSTQTEDLVICLISGGGSALLSAPSDGVQLDSLRELIRQLLLRGASISEINTLRKHLEIIKGGQLVRFALPATVISLILSDVVGDPLDMIASGPTAPDPSTFDDAYFVLKKYRLIDIAHDSIINQLKKGLNGEVQETPKVDDPIFNKTQNIIIGSNKLAAQAAIRQAKIEGFNTLLLTTYLQGEARHVGEFLATIARQLGSENPMLHPPACIICGGETTVVVTGDGKGGRNTELALGAVELLSGLSRTVLISMATDGSDGSTDAAGAVVTGETLKKAAKLNLSPDVYLEYNDSYNFFQKLGDLLKPGLTQTNVNDLVFIFQF
jgi:glycerate 2-kinase